MKSIYKHNIIRWVAIWLPLLVSCDSNIVVTGESEEINTPFVYLAVTRAQQAGVESFNEDQTDFEDRVHDLAMLVFDSSTGEKVCEYFDENIPFAHKEKTFTIKMKPGKRDFYFVANMPMNDLKGITDRVAMQTYMSTFRTFDNNLYFGAKEAKGFPMSRIYTNQTVTEGGTIMNPKPFKPVNTSSVTEEQVKLMRTVAKIEILLSGATDAIQGVTYNNVQGNFLIGFSTLTPYNDTNLKKIENFTNTDVTKHVFYVPERLINDENITWNQSTPNIPINYFEIKTKAGRTFNIPIVWNGNEAKENYLKFARKEETNNDVKPNYSVARNQHYEFKVVIPKDAKEIEVNLAVKPWTLVESEITYGEARYISAIAFVEGNGEWLEDGKTILLNGQTKAKMIFKLRAPAGGIWQASLTNGLDFSLTPVPDSELDSSLGEKGGIAGIADPNGLYTFYITPLKSYDGTPRLTEIYITVNGKEIQLSSKLAAENIESGPTKRLVFKQVE